MREAPGQSGRRYDGSVTYRLTQADKQRLLHEAAELGLTSQQLFEQRMLGMARPVGRDGRPPRVTQAEELPIAG